MLFMDTETAYNHALDYLYSFVDYSLKHSSELAKADFNLDRMRALMAALGNPQNTYPTIHVAGTKGKGSTSALCAAALQAAGFKVGLYTSPHLLDFCERVQVNAEPVSHTELAELVEQIKPAVAQIPQLTTFEITTALGFLYFAQCKVDVAVIEVGLGGRLDATNVITPRVSVITSLSYDHMAVLGDTLGKIAGEKAGIIKPGVPVVSSPQKLEALEVLEKVASEHGCELTLIGRDIICVPETHTILGQDFRIQRFVHLQPKTGVSIQYSMFCIPLLGVHQVENAATAYTALKQSGFNLSDAEIAKGFAAVRWPCRFEVASRENPTVIFDSAHNEDSFLRLTQTLDEYFPGRKVVLIFGVSEDKHIAAMLGAIKDKLERLIVTRANHPRALEPEKIIETAKKVGVEIESAVPVEKALARALEIAENNGSIVLSAGSMFVTAETKKAFGQRTQLRNK
jgi:dihydrofolate synthase/folylpolyglutamate synthase